MAKINKKETVVKARADQADDLQKLNSRINRIVGQLGGIKRMLETNRTPVDVLTQLNSVQASVRSIQLIILQQYIDKTFIAEATKHGNKATDKLVEIVKNIKD